MFGTFSYLAVIYVVVALVYTFLPLQDLNEWLWNYDHEVTEKTWTEAHDEDIFE